jgi:hypothetical protein
LFCVFRSLLLGTTEAVSQVFVMSVRLQLRTLPDLSAMTRITLELTENSLCGTEMVN